MELLSDTIAILLVIFNYVETSKHTPVKVCDERLARRCMRYRQAMPPYNFSATLQGFLPSKLEPLGFSLDGQLRVSS